MANTIRRVPDSVLPSVSFRKDFSNNCKYSASLPESIGQTLRGQLLAVSTDRLNPKDDLLIRGWTVGATVHLLVFPPVMSSSALS